MTRLAITTIALLFTLSAPVWAGDTNDHGTRINLSITEEMKVPQDEFVASLRIEKTGAKPEVLQTDINTIMNAGMAKIKAATGVTVTTGGYSVYENYVQPTDTNKAPKREWRATQSIDLTSRDKDALTKLVGELQTMEFLIGNLSATLSDEGARGYEDQLLARAITKIKDRAALSTKLLGKDTYIIRELNVNTGWQAVPMMMKTMRAEMAMADGMVAAAAPAPSVEAGEATLSLSIAAVVGVEE